MYPHNMWNWLIKQFSVEHINKQDRFGRTALHYAAIAGNIAFMNVLTTMKADETIQDNYQKTSRDYAHIDLSAKVSTHRLMKSSDFMKRNHLDISSCVKNCFDDCSYTDEECKAKLHETVEAFTGFSDRTSYVVNTWEECRYDYGDTTRRVAGALQIKSNQIKFISKHKTQNI